MEMITLTDIAKYTKGKQNGNGIISNISIDSKNILDDCLFVAIKGNRFDGNDFIENAISNGAKAVVTTKDIVNAPSIKVEDSNQAFLDLAKGYKAKFKNLKTVAVTGSVGKTTTKEMIYCVLKQIAKTYKNEGNLNNHIGVPLTIFGLDKKQEYAVFEMGMNHSGEIKALSDVVCPDLAVVSNVGISHIEYLGSREGIRDAKLEIISGLSGSIILNGDEPLLRDLNIQNEIIYFGIDGSDLDVTCKDIKTYIDYTTFVAICGDREINITINTIGKHNVMNALSAIAVGIKFSASDEQIAKGMLSFENVDMRQNVFKHKEYTIIDDCYNASPDSMKASLDVLSEMDGNNKIAVLGSMGELGDFALDAHKEVLEYAKTSADKVYLFGHTWSDLDLGECELYDDKDLITDKIRQNIEKTDVILFKGSRALKIEEVLKKLIGEGK